MNPFIAAFICICGIAGLFYLDRDRTVRTSKALWLPTIYLWIVGSRPISYWFGVTASNSLIVQSDGSPIDAAIFALLLAAALVVLIQRRQRTFALLMPNWPIVVYFFYCLVSAAWSYHPDIAVKRWIKATDDLAMVLIVVTDPRPAAALRRLVSRVGYILLPFSLLFIKYFPLLGRGYAPNGMLMNTGTTSNKNVFGVILLVVSLYTLWRVMGLWSDKKATDRRRHLFAQIVLLSFGLLLFRMADSATSLGCFAFGGGFILMANRRAIKKRPVRLHVLCLASVVVAGIILLVGGEGVVANALGRQSNLSGRTDIWAAVIPAAPNALVGAGYESFWISPNVVKFQQSLVGWWHPEQLNEAHNGYIEIYLNLGWVGVCLISCILISGYRRGVAAFRRNPSVGGLMLAYIVISSVYSITEAGFRSPDPIWIFLLLAIVSSTAISSGVVWDPVTRKYATGPWRYAAKRRVQVAVGV